MNKELKKRAREFFREHYGVVQSRTLFAVFNDLEIEELKKEGLLEHTVRHIWHWKGD
jgi:hypothetical protein